MARPSSSHRHPGSVPPPHLRLSRRSLLLGGAGTLGLVALGGLSACSGGDDEEGSATTVGEDTRNLLSIFNAQGPYLIPGVEQRFTYAIADFEGVPVEGPESLTFTLTPEGDADPVEVEVARYGEGVPTPYYPVRAELAVEGIWTATTEVDGQELRADLFVSPAEDVTVLQRGDEVPSIETPTVDDARGVDPICTRDPVCDLHGQTLARALDADGPVALLVATPAYCATALCGPVLDVLIGTQDANPAFTYLHEEVYANPEAVENVAEAEPAPITDAMGLTYEPSLFVVGADGRIVDRLDNVYDAVEAQEALDRAEA